MLTRVADGVLVHQSEFLQSNAVVVEGRDGVLVVDAGVLGREMEGVADDLAPLGLTVVAGFSTHPHWDHLVWHARLGDVPRHATAACAADVDAVLSTPGWRDRVTGMMPENVVDEVPLDLFGLVTGLAPGATELPWDGPRVRVIEHRAHAPGHAALLVEEHRVLVAGDMLSDILVPMIDHRAEDPVADHLAALDRLEAVVGDVDVVVPGHGTVGTADQLRARIDQDRAYVRALGDGVDPDDPRLSQAAPYNWVRGLHDGQRDALAQRAATD